MNYTKLFKDIRHFLKPFANIWQREVLDLHPFQDHILAKITAELKSYTDEELIRVENELTARSDASELFSNLLTNAKELESRISQFQILEQDLTHKKNHQYRKMSQKKIHEIKMITRITQATFPKLNSVLDFGGGVGHLCQHLTLNLDVESFCIDCESDFLDSGKKRISRYYPQIENSINFLNHSISKEMIADQKLKDYLKPNQVLFGLHACGDLSNNLIQFAVETHSYGLMNLGCCYHKLTDQFNFSNLAKEDPILFSNHALTLATRSNTPITKVELAERLKVKRYRYSFFHLIKTKLNIKKDLPVGNLGKSIYELSFHDYVKACLVKTNLELELTNIEIDEFFNSTMNQEFLDDTFRAGILRGIFGRSIELYLLSDRLLYVLDNNKEAKLVKLFDRNLSPRNIALLVRAHDNKTKNN